MFWAILWFLAVVAAVAIVAALTINAKEEEEIEEELPLARDFSEEEGLGAPLFANVAGRKPLLRHLTINTKVWALTPAGPQEMTVKWVEGSHGMIENGNYAVHVFLDTEYFSTSVANKMSHHCGAWRVGNIRSIRNTAVEYNNVTRWENRHWLEDESIFGFGDLFDALIFYDLMFNDFTEEYDYYNDYEPAWDIPPLDEMVEEPFVEPTDEGEPSQPYEPPIEEVIDPEPEPPPIEEVIDPEPVVEAPEPEPERYVPDPEPIADSGWSSSDDSGYSDSGGGWDSGGDDGGWDD
jgi:hypothetical protein